MVDGGIKLPIKKEEPSLEEISAAEYRLIMEQAIQQSISEANDYMRQLNAADHLTELGYKVRYYRMDNSVLYRFEKKKIGFDVSDTYKKERE